MPWPGCAPSTAKRSVAFVLAVVVSVFVLARNSRAQSPVNGEGVLKFLDETIAWHRNVSTLTQSPANSREALFIDAQRQSSIQAVRLAFEFALAVAANPDLNNAGGKSENDRSRNLMQIEAAADQRLEELQRQIDQFNRRIQAAPERLRAELISRRDLVTAQFNLTKTRRDSLHGFLGYLSAPPGGGLSARINDLRRSVPEIQETAKRADAATLHPAAQDFHPESAGIAGLTTEIFTLARKARQIGLLAEQTDALRKENEKLRTPLRKAFQELIRRAEDLAQDVETESVGELKSDKKALDGLVLRFKQFTSAAGPLSRQNMSLEGAYANLVQWRTELREEHSTALRYLLLRLGMLGLAVLVLFAFSEVWRRATMRYVKDIRRRRQFLLLRRIVIGCMIAMFVTLSVVTEFGSLATFAGFSAAGIAVASQSIILSVVAYFFLAGRWGVRVGDRVTVSGVTGEVIEIGLFRMYLMELSGPAMGATGRIVVFPNAVFFQPTAMFKQLPGVDYAWRTVSLTLSRDCDHALAEKRVLAAVESVYRDYRDVIERQYAAARTSLNLHGDTPRPEARIRFVDSGLEVVVRYPVVISSAVAIDDRITRELLDLVAREPNLQLHIAGSPKIQALA